MSKKRKIDFILYEDEFEKRIFRFYPRQSSCHSFDEEPPKTWDDVFKVYYHYAVIEHFKNWNDTYVRFNSGCDECSEIRSVGFNCIDLANGIEKFTFTSENGKERHFKILDREIHPFGMGVSWNIHKTSTGYYKFEMFKYFDDGYRFYLLKEQLKPFGEYLIECCEYMLQHGNPI